MKCDGFIVMESSDEFEQGLTLDFDKSLPSKGILNWRAGQEPVYIFKTRKIAREAMRRTEHYRLAFDKKEKLPLSGQCVITPIKFTP